jgi:hypothetical protein
MSYNIISVKPNHDIISFLGKERKKENKENKKHFFPPIPGLYFCKNRQIMSHMIRLRSNSSKEWQKNWNVLEKFFIFIFPFGNYKNFVKHETCVCFWRKMVFEVGEKLLIFHCLV